MLLDELQLLPDFSQWVTSSEAEGTMTMNAPKTRPVFSRYLYTSIDPRAHTVVEPTTVVWRDGAQTTVPPSCSAEVVRRWSIGLKWPPS